MTTPDTLRWHSPNDPPLALAGFAWFAQDHVYRRLPLHPSKPLPEAVEMLANQTAGGQIRLQTDSARLAVRVKLAGKADMDHMPSSGQCGFDLYVGPVGAQRYANTTRYAHLQSAEYEYLLMQAPGREMRNLTLNFPLYQGVNEVLVGLDDDAVVLPPPPYADPRPLVVYGTSITQGGCASRPGMLYTNILSRRLNRPFINLGFSGSGRGEPEVAEVMAEIADPACFVLDYEANTAGPEHLQQTLPPFLAILRAAHLATPILLLSRIPFANDLLQADWLANRLQNRDFMRDTAASMRAQGDLNIHFHDASTLLGDNYDECTVDGIHPTDLGFMRMADGLEGVVRGIVEEAVAV